MPRQWTDAELDECFRYHRPTPEAARRHTIVTEETLRVAKILRDVTPVSDGLDDAIKGLAMVRMWANQGIACNHHLLPPEEPSNG